MYIFKKEVVGRESNPFQRWEAAFRKVSFHVLSDLNLNNWQSDAVSFMSFYFSYIQSQ